MKKQNNEIKIDFYNALTKLLNMGFDLDKNTARDLLECTNYILNEDKKNKKRKEVK